MPVDLVEDANTEVEIASAIRLPREIEKSKEALRVRERALAERRADATSLRGTAGK